MADARLVTHPLFADADQQTINRALDQIAISRRDLIDGQRYMTQGDPYEALSLLVAGTLVATIEDMSGRSLLIETLVAPEVLAAPVLYSPNPRIPVTLTARRTATVCSIPLPELDRLCVRFPSIYRRLLQDSGEKFVFISTKLKLVQFASLRHKIGGYLISLVREQVPERARVGEVSVEIPYTRERLAELFGVARPSLSRTLGDIAREGLLEIEGPRVTIRSLSGLRDLMSEQERPKEGR